MSPESPTERLELAGMNDIPPEAIPPWEAEWTLFGPIANEGDSSNWPGKLGWDPLPLDAATEIPAEITIEGQVYRPQKTFSPDGLLDFDAIFGPTPGAPMVYLLQEIDSPEAARLPIAFGANWGTEWWLNGELVYETRVGNFGDWHLRNSHQFEAPLQPGRNLLVVRVISGGANDWTMTVGHLPPRPGGSAEALPVQLPILSPLRQRTRDYTATGLRIEERPAPPPVEVAAMQARVMAEHGVQAHWIGVVDPTGSPYGTSEFLPQRHEGRPEDEDLLIERVQHIHSRGMAAVTWFPGNHCRTAWETHADWRVFPFPGFETDGHQSHWGLCPLTPYGEALTQFVLESLDKYDLDGFWFDGTTWATSGAVACACKYCRRRFREDTGLEFPAAADWNDPAFQRWVAWRYEAFMNFWGQLADRVRRVHPHATIVINHLHRLRSSWLRAIPLDRYPARVLVGTEAQDSPFESAFHGRLVAAYGKPQSEVWMGIHKLFTRTSSWLSEADPLYRYAHHALATLTAGSWMSYGTPDPGEKPADAYDRLGSLVNPRKPFEGGTAEPYVGLHLSQQSETHFFSRYTDWGFPKDCWQSFFGWHNLLAEKQLLTRLAFDAELTRAELFKYPVFLAPLSVALADEQVKLLEEYVERGGVLIVGPGFGACDRYGNPADPARVSALLGHDAVAADDAQPLLEAADPETTVRALGAGQVVELRGNVGLRFDRHRSPLLADEVAALLTRLAPPRVEIEGPRRLHVGLFRRPGKLYLHVQNFMAWSQAGSLPDPALTAPEPVENLRVTLHGLNAFSARLPLSDTQLDLAISGDTASLVIPRIDWHEVVELEV